MKMYIANATRQTVCFAYRLPGIPGVKQHFIPVGKQLLLPVDLTQQDVDYLIEYNATYGFVHVKEVDRTKPFFGICYNIDKPVPPPRLHSAMMHNIEVLKERGVENRKLAAIAASDTLEKSLAQNPGLANLANMEMTVVEEGRPGQVNNPNPIAEGFHVSHDVTAEQNNRLRPTGRRGRGKG